MREEGDRLGGRHVFFRGRVLKARGKQGEGGPDEAERWDDGEVDRGGRRLEREEVLCIQVDRVPDIYGALTLPPPLTAFYGRDKQGQTRAPHHNLLPPVAFQAA